jgi:hypothetical protein
MVIIAPEALPPSKEIITAFNFCFPAFSLFRLLQGAQPQVQLIDAQILFGYIALERWQPAVQRPIVESKLHTNQAKLLCVFATLIGQLQ